MKKLVIIALLFCVKQVNAQVCFSPPANYPVVNGASSVTSADFNGDTKLDLAVTNNGSDNVSVLLGDGAGNFGTATNFSAGTNPYGICSADFNGDGFKDIAVSNHGSNNVSVLLGNGSGGFAAAVNFSVGSGPVSVATADFDGDGKADLATANFASNDVSVLLGDGLGGFGTATSYTVGSTTTAPNPHSVIAADFDGDGKADFATANYNSNNISVLHSTGTGFGAVYNSVALANSAPYTIISSDMNADGRADLAVANSGSTNNIASVFLGNSVGTFTTTAVNINLGSSSNAVGITAGDFNGDGKQDLATVNNSSDNIYILLSTSTGTVTTFVTTPSAVFSLTSGAGPNALTNADFNGDGKPDIATANWGTSESSVLINAPLPVVTITASSPAVCKGDGDTLTVSGALSYVWAPAASLSCGTCSVTVTSNTVTTTKTYTVTGTDANGCTNKATQLVTLNPLPVITVTATPNPVCKGASCVITAGGAVTYTISNPGTFLGAPFVPTVTATYSVSGTDANGCIGKSTKTITVTPVVTAKPKYDTLCLGASSFIVAGGALTYTWTNNPAINNYTVDVNNDTVSITPIATSTYVVSGTDASGCTNTTSTVVTVMDSAAGATVNPKVTAVAKEDTLCPGGSAKIVAKNAVTYTWTSSPSITNYTLDINNDTVSVMPTTTTIYTVTGTDARNCKNKAMATVTVLTGSHPNYPKLIIKPSEDTICNGSNAIIVIKGAVTYTWTGSASGNNDTVFVSPTVTSTYSVSGTNLGSCTNTISTKITVMDTSTAYCHIGIREINNLGSIKIYPNPNNGSFVVDANNSEKLLMRVFDLSGKVVLSQIITERTIVNANSLNEGVYIINLSSSEGVINKRLMIVK